MAFQPSSEGQLTEKGLGFGYWWVTHKIQVRRAFAVSIGVIAVPLLAYGAYGFADWFFGSGVAERAQMASQSRPLIDYTFFRERNTPRDLRIEAPQVLAAGDKNYDVIARVQNQNPRWWAEIEYRFEAGSISPTGRAFILPGESKLVTALGVKAETRPAISKASIEKVSWHRVNPHETLPDYASWSASRLALAVTDAKFTVPAAGDPLPVHRATFIVTNETGFGYRDIGFLVTLLSGTRVVGVNKVTIGELRAGERREVDATWFSAMPTVTKIEVKPELNIFDVRSYISPGR